MPHGKRYLMNILLHLVLPTILVIIAVVGLIKIKELARMLASFYQSRAMHVARLIVWYVFLVILAILVFIWGILVGIVSYGRDVDIRNTTDASLEKFMMRFKPVAKVKVVKKTPLNHARIVVHVKPAKRRRNGLSAYRALRTGIMISSFIPKKW